MSLGTAGGYLLGLVAVVCLDIALVRWRRRRWRPGNVSSARLSKMAADDNGVNGRGSPQPAPEPAATGSVVPVEQAAEPPRPVPEAVASTLPAEGPSGATEPAPNPVTLPLVPSAEQPPTVVTTTPGFPVQVVSARSDGPNNGLARVSISVEMPVGAVMRLTIETALSGRATITEVTMPAAAQPAALIVAPAPSLTDVGPAPHAVPRAMPRPVAQAAAAWRARWPAWRPALAAQVKSLPLVLFWSSLAIYLVTRLIGLDRYPIFFFTDEAVHTVLAADFVHTGLQNPDHEFLPTFFSLGPSYNLNGVSVYLQAVPYLLFGKSETVTRATSALVTLVAAIAVGLILRDILKRRYWWTATLLLSITPAWFLHSRTAFEYVEVAAYYAGFLYCYLRYRHISPRGLYGVVLFAALAFYTHGLGQVLMGVATLVLAVADWRYHWQQRQVVSRALVLGLVLALPYARYSLAHPTSAMDELRQRASYWVQGGLSLSDKLSRFFSEYLVAFSPKFWFQPDNGRDIERHVMKGYGNLWLPTLPLLALGLLYVLRNVRTSASRTILLALLVAPVGSALVAIGIPRVLWEIIPLTVIGAIGLCLVLEWLEGRRVPATALALGTFVVLGGVNVYMLRDALVNGGLWPQDYTLAGTQFGARQVFGEAIPGYLAEHPDALVIVSSTWANGTDMFIPFFLTRQQASHVQMQSLDYFVSQRRDLKPNTEVVLPAYEYNQAAQNPKLADIVVDQIIPYPNGQPGFYFLRFGYSAQADAIFGAEHEKLVEPITETILFDGQNITVSHPHFGAGQLRDMLDGDRYTLVNAPGLNPMVFDFGFPTARSMTGLTLITGSLPDFTVTATVHADNSSTPRVYSQEFVGLPPDPTVKLDFDKGLSTVVRLRLEIKNNADTTPGVNIHIREVQFR